jgi:3-oxoadipate enol-lactonase
MPYSMDMMAADTAGLMESLGIEKAYLFGHSMGGAIGQCFALRYLEKLRCLMLGSTLAGGPHTAWGKSDPPLRGSATGVSPEEQLRARLAATFSERFFQDNPDIIDEIVRAHLQYPTDPKGFSLQWDAVVTHDVYDRLPEITLPTLVIHGSEDRILLEENAHIIASRIPGAELAIMEGVGHTIYSEAPEELHWILFDFMGRHAPKAA